MVDTEQVPTHVANARVAPMKPQRVLACILCQQRKVKCDRKFPCSNCTRAGTQCVPGHAVTTRQRRRRFPERDLLDRIRRYEDLLRKNNIPFEPLHGNSTDIATPETADTSQHPSPLENTGSSEYSPRDESGDNGPPKAGFINIWNAWSQSGSPDGSDDNDDEDHDSDSSQVRVRHATVKKALEHMFEKGDDHLLFGARASLNDLSALHPPQVQIFRFWQIYLDNVNPLLKVTHTPTLQPRIINAIGNLGSIEPALEALMFSIYCVALISITEAECRTSFGSERGHLLANYSFGCQQALLKSGILRTTERECLTAFYIYLISIKAESEPRALSTMLGVAVRLAQHMRMHSESANAKYPALEAEMRRRLWWSLAAFDARVSEQSDFKGGIMCPGWDCSIPSNVNDFDLRPEMKVAPASQEKITEATFAVVRSELADFVRNCSYYLDFINPLLKPVAHVSAKSGDLSTLTKSIEEKYLTHCDERNPLHFMIIWVTRSYLAKHTLFEQYQKQWRSDMVVTEEQRDVALCHALDMFVADTNLISSPLVSGYYQYVATLFPFPAYLHVVQDLRRRAHGKHAQRAWDTMSKNYEVRCMTGWWDPVDNPMTKIVHKAVVQAWSAYEKLAQESGREVSPPFFVTSMQTKSMQMNPALQTREAPQDANFLPFQSADVPTDMDLDLGGNNAQFNFDFLDPMQQPIGGFQSTTNSSAVDLDLKQLDFTGLGWNSVRAPRW
ncbi:hypothetical protein BU24DRAFT_421145 [Aaosphaeria arxii CBS 175.79]|uniref:Zn(2)-C6 fungal-type domain-containing protein n=1 Tax=Aaosphaeria arxii CBS 175.79 TaxID=1450172 RepID=A0A6A5XZ24_9PLEO|nr:uncharacterized protein BU24DRAFT_421145 [Aaosphaeria arxii CBS 175.79]KAF2018143.1 hypothetical protein BU24DRAFT_421145 [Aaosphaeria arxii CBS 175.79]